MRIDRELALVEETLITALQSDVGLLSRTGTRILRAGGKRLRPRVVLYAYAAAGGQEMSTAVPVAAAVELLHTASLVHDDINDQSDMRRGQPSVNAELGTSLALLMGDYIFVRFLNLMADFDRRLIRILARSCNEIVEGETLQMLRLGDLTMDEESYLTIIRQKTASLFAACAEVGSLLAGAPQTQIEALRNYGLNLGIAFQVRDDTLDLIGDSEVLGKPAASDLAQGKMSLATIYAARMSDKARAALASADINRARDLLHETGALDYAMQKAREYAEEAKRALRALPDSAAKLWLGELADLAVVRQH